MKPVSGHTSTPPSVSDPDPKEAQKLSAADDVAANSAL